MRRIICISILIILLLGLIVEGGMINNINIHTHSNDLSNFCSGCCVERLAEDVRKT